MDSNFRSTVLQHPDDEGERDHPQHQHQSFHQQHQMRDLMNPQPSTPSSTSHHIPGFSLRSPPPKADYHQHTPASSYSTTDTHHNRHHLTSSTTPASQYPFASSAYRDPPPGPPPASAPTPGQRTSPMRPPPLYAPPRASAQAPALARREGSGFYDPTSDSIASESRSWNESTSKPLDPFDLPRNTHTESRSSHQSHYASPQQSTSIHSAHRSLSRPPPLGGLTVGSPPRRPRDGEPSDTSSPTMSRSNGTSSSGGLPSLLKPASPTLPARSANVMSFSNILTSSEPIAKTPLADVEHGHERERERENDREHERGRDRELPSLRERDQPARSFSPLRESTKSRKADSPHAQESSILAPPDIDVGMETEYPVETEAEIEPESEVLDESDAPVKTKKDNRRKSSSVKKIRSRVNDIKDSEPSKSRRSSANKASSKRQSNGSLKNNGKSAPANNEKKIARHMEMIEASASKADQTDLDFVEAQRIEFMKSATKRRRRIQDIDVSFCLRRDQDLALSLGKRLLAHAEFGRRRYDEGNVDAALAEVKEQELHAEKERKKDMQRKRRREKSMAVTIEQREAALARALAAADETERQKHLRDAERASKKAQQTKLILQKGLKGPVRNVDLQQMEGIGNSSVLPSETDTPKKSKSRAGNRLKKSREQKQAEKDSAEAAQAALDAGEELPSREESKARIIRLKSKVSKPDKAEETDKETETKEVKASAKETKEREKAKEKEKTAEPPAPEAKFESKGYNQIYDQIWRDLARKDVGKTFKVAVDSYATKASNLKKTALLASKEAKRWQLRTNKGAKDQQARAKRVMRDMMSFWKRNEREERDHRKAAERQELENQRREEADREAARQKRKLNFLISQTELYSHFIGKKIKTDEVERSTDNPEIAKDTNSSEAPKPSIAVPTTGSNAKVTDFENLDFDNEDETQLQAAAMANAQSAIEEAQKKARDFNNEGPDMDETGEMNFQNPTGLGDVEIEQPKLINAQLKEYQLKGLNWLANLYEQGINGILADEMGLGKTVQSISVMAYLAEKYDVWGPFLVVCPASTLHNWEQEVRKFVPEFKILPYWGTAGDRKVLRKFWDRKHSIYKKDAPFHVCITSYQMVVSDVSYFQKMRWQYMILDEAQAIKSSQSSRWKCLLSFHCRNRLLLTGTPIQNNMQELWALLHFIMPSLFDSHDEFSEWFSKDIESHATSNTKLNEDQLKRLHMILKPFMLRRVKKHVQKELGDKIELDVYCDLTYRQREYYRNLRRQISVMDLIEKATMGDDNDSGTLMNLVMQFRKVCNHPDLFERAETASAFNMGYFAETASFIREGNQIIAPYSPRGAIEYKLPQLVWRNGGRLCKPGSDNVKAGWRNKYLSHMMNIYHPDNVRQSMEGADAFSWLRFADTSVGEVYNATHESIMDRSVKAANRSDRLEHLGMIYDEEDGDFTPRHALFLIKERSSRRIFADLAPEGALHNMMNAARGCFNMSGLGRLEQAGRPSATAIPIDISCTSSATEPERLETLFNISIRRAIYGPNSVEQKALITEKIRPTFWPTRALLPTPDKEKSRFTNITVPSMHRFVTDSGKLAKLDELLFKLKNEGHRVLLYFQMTRMIDLMEEYLTYRNYKYCRLDGSTKLEDRRDTVHDFQTRPEIFIFLLSTRAGGLGINLTTADTVIFYDSDWNPTIDSQAMDRAHRLGQKKQVTVYRLITRGTIEERIRTRAMQKEEVQRVVIQGGGASVDFSGRRPPENRNRDIAMWLVDDEQAELIEKRERELLESGEYDKLQKKKGGKRKRAGAAANGDMSLDDMYHEGEGRFDDGAASAGGGGGGVVANSDEPAEQPDGKTSKKRKVAGGPKKARSGRQRVAAAAAED
ncbi:putative DNA helicase INO80 [Ceratocystis lukuohia]|uniref:Chromatin-remodeling ATPase INO80 n=1 Tax=Ceratocystis lukuohia TaxID=2019550 RepID=A0ABR4MUC3_9PEZI